MDPSLGLPETQPQAPPPPPAAAVAAPTADLTAAPTPAMIADPTTTAHYNSDSYLYNAQPQPHLPHPHPVAYSSYHCPNTDPNPNPYTYRYPYSSHDPEAAVESEAHHAGDLGFRAAADPYSEYARGICVHRDGYAGSCSVPASYSYPVGGAPAAAAVPLYYGDHGGKEPRGYVMERVIHPYDNHLIGYGAGLQGPCIGLEQPIPSSHVNAPHWNNKAMHSTSRSTKKKVPKGQKWTTMQSAYCEVCKVKCDTQEVLEIHKQGKKHMKNLHKLQEFPLAESKDAPITTSVDIQLTKTTSVENTNPATLAEKAKATGESKRKKNAATSEDLEEKKRRVLEGGAAAEEVKVCVLCNVVVNSQKVYDYHIAGQKHAIMLKKQQDQKVAV